mgnify:FL=1|tara:strand:- start:3645 stop:4514 length:870 start_codon:yes stop_codon:yes gene_type:complete
MALVTLTAEPGEVKTQNQDGTVSYNIKYLAIYDAIPSGAFEADNLAGFAGGIPLPIAPSLSLQDWTTTQTDNLLAWRFDCNYKSAVESTIGGGGGGSNNSINIEPFSWSETREKILLNTVGDPILPAIQDTEYWSGIRIIYNDTSLDMSLFELGGAVNDTQITVAGIDVPPYCMKAGALEFRKVTDGLSDTWQLTLPLYFCFKKAEGTGATHAIGDVIGFQKEVPNNGFKFANGKDILSIDGEPITSPAFLNAAGDTVITDIANTFSLLATPAELSDFSDFNLPTSAPS